MQPFLIQNLNIEPAITGNPVEILDYKVTYIYVDI